ncbi:type II CRISPR RNA-guided endonuclease Cas9 [Thermoflexibacter ruber]|uniref:CRISPR-associated endonuclease Cas9 n=1 Tax=Thermoflexibacter ruber TaxID=1003 RepID=A0A1I2F0I4_9BACT|nr:type II CRISPR RNA-guided endonuclease Cas9 [Thermoflexibacter ruber]SFE98483.1 CRISPR subtype II/NMENI RNA-guided endonuclease Cas9/Csn1 [Thermoflexibacter ruber]
MGNVLGLDIGTNSIGWAIVNTEKKLIHSNIHIFPQGVTEKTGEPRNIQRRAARGARRNNHRYKQRREKLQNLLSKTKMLPKYVEKFPYHVYELRAKALDKQISLEELGRVFLHLNQRRGFQSNRKEQANADKDKEKELGKVKEGIKELESLLQAHHSRTIGELYWKLLQDRKHDFTAAQAIRNRFPTEKRYTSRELLKDEFEQIWEKQKQFYPQILTEKLKNEIGKETIFYQRKLKTQKGKTEKCPFEPKSSCIPKAAIEFQEFRIWQKLSTIKVTIPDKNRIADLLTLEEKQKIAYELDRLTNKEMRLTFKQIKALFKKEWGTEANLNYKEEDDIKGNTTAIKLRRVLGEKYDEIYQAYNEAFEYEEKRKTNFFKIWHALLYADNDKWLKKYAVEKLGFSEVQAEKYAAQNLEDGNGSLSYKAIRPILAYLKTGEDYTNACLLAGYDHALLPDKHRKLLPKIPKLQNNELRNPTVQRALTETIKLVNRLLQEYEIESICIETARELKKTKKKRDEREKELKAKTDRRRELAKFLAENSMMLFGKQREFDLNSKPDMEDVRKYELWLELAVADKDLNEIGIKKGFADFARKIGKDDMDKYRLWIEAQRISVYTGKVIPFQRLFSKDYEIEHILPYSRSFDDSFANKSIAEAWFNAEKGNLTPYEYFQKKTKEEWLAFKHRIKMLPKPKQERLLWEKEIEGFRNSQLTDTAYIAREMAKRLQSVCKDVQTTQGAITSMLRRYWGLNALLNPEGENEKDRGDHRHHALDAIVIACTNRAKVQLINWANAKDIDWKKERRKIDLPWSSFRYDVQQQLHGMLVSYRQDNGILIKRKAITKTKNGKKKTSVQIGIRGELHEATYYGKHILPKGAPPAKDKKTKTAYFVRKKLSSLNENQVEQIVDRVIRETVQKAIAEKGFKQALAEPIYMPDTNNKGWQMPIKKVRIAINKDDEGMIPLYKKEGDEDYKRNLYVPSGSNYIMGIYQDPNTGEKEVYITSFYEAVQRKIKKLPVLDSMRGSKKLVLTARQGDMFVVYENHPDEIEKHINWDRIDLEARRFLFDKLYIVRKMTKTNGKIFLSQHHLAKVNVDSDPLPLKIYPLGKNFNGIPVEIDILGNIRRKKSV